MAKSSARKKREKRVREHQLDPIIRRGTWGDLSPITKMTKSKHQLLAQKEKKYKRNHSSTHEENGFFYISYLCPLQKASSANSIKGSLCLKNTLSI